MKTRPLVVLGSAISILAGCTNPSKPEISVIDASLPFNKAMEAVVKSDRFLTQNLRPGFHRSADGTIESYTVSWDDHGSATIEHLVLLTKKWCSQNGGKVDSFPEIPVLQGGLATVVRQGENEPVTGKAYNMVCYRGEEPLAAAAVGRNTYFLNSSQFRKATRGAGASVLDVRSSR